MCKIRLSMNETSIDYLYFMFVWETETGPLIY